MSYDNLDINKEAQTLQKQRSLQALVQIYRKFTIFDRIWEIKDKYTS